jgi:aspartate kinase
MLVFKFGGASVKTSGGILNLAHIVESFKEHLVIVVSAFGKTTNSLERIHDQAYKKDSFEAEFNTLKEYHVSILKELFQQEKHPAFAEINQEFEVLRSILVKEEKGSYDQQYDQVVSFGEVLSTKIVSAFLNERGLKNKWVDIRKCLKTNSTWREAVVDWELSEKLMKDNFNTTKNKIHITQGFLGFEDNGLTTTLGREGSDYTAAILAHILEAEKVVIWKDVPGVLNADPKYFDNTVRLGQLSYLDAIELAYYGASVIHPKTIKPLQNKGIKLHVKSFVYPGDPGTIVGDIQYESLIPSFIFKMDQVLIHISPRDFSFIVEASLTEIFETFARHGIRINLMQNSAVSFMALVNNRMDRIKELAAELEKTFSVSYEEGLELITIRYYDTATIERVMINKQLVLEQKNKRTIQLVVKDLGNGTKY